MRPQAIVGVVLIVLGIVAIAVRSITFFTTDQEVGPLGMFVWDINKPHTIFINPIAGAVAIAAGFGLIALSRRAS